MKSEEEIEEAIEVYRDSTEPDPYAARERLRALMWVMEYDEDELPEYRPPKPFA